ncbi:MAG: hypothetical protein ACRD93_07715, partial [Nitrososphaeraceae archaeon]
SPSGVIAFSTSIPSQFSIKVNLIYKLFRKPDVEFRSISIQYPVILERICVIIRRVIIRLSD